MESVSIDGGDVGFVWIFEIFSWQCALSFGTVDRNYKPLQTWKCPCTLTCKPFQRLSWILQMSEFVESMTENNLNSTRYTGGL